MRRLRLRAQAAGETLADRLRRYAEEDDPLAVLIDESVLTRPQIDAVLSYRSAYPDEIKARIELHRHETAAASNT